MYLPIIFPCLPKRPDFVWDDRAAVLGNPDVQPGSPLKNIIWHDFWGHHDIQSPDSHKSYRPVTVASLRLDNTVWGPHAVAFLAHNSLLHVANAILLALLTYRLSRRSYTTSLVSGAIFLLHPLQTEAVSSVVCRADLLATMLILIGALVQLELSQQLRRRCDLLAAAATCLVVNTVAVLATLSKETGAAAWIVLLLLQVLSPLLLEEQVTQCRPSGAPSHSREQQASTRTTVLSTKGGVQDGSRGGVSKLTLQSLWSPEYLLPSATTAVAAVFLRWRLALNGGRLFPWTLYENQLPGIADGTSRALTILETHAHYASLLAWPFGRLSYYHGYAEIAPATGWSAWSAAAASMYLLVAAAAGLWVWRIARHVLGAVSAGPGSDAAAVRHTRARTASLAAARLVCLVGLVAAPFAPASNVFVFVGTEVAERLLYLPMAGVAALSAFLIAPLLGGDSDGDPDEEQRIRGSAEAASHSAALTDSVPASANASASMAAPASARRISCSRLHLMAYMRLPARLSAAVLGVACIGAGVTRSVEWADERSLFAAGVRVAPASVKALSNLGTLLAASPLQSAASPVASAAGGPAPSSPPVSSIHDWAVARRVSEACVTVFPESPACWSTLAALAQREDTLSAAAGSNSSDSDVWSLPPHLSGAPAPAVLGDSDAARGIVAGLSSALSVALDSIARGPLVLARNAIVSLVGPSSAVSSSSSSWSPWLRWMQSWGATDAATAAGDTWESVLRRLPVTGPHVHTTAPQPAAASGDDPAQGLKPQSPPVSGRARALDYLWRSVQGSADTRLPLPCVVTEGMADIYLAIAEERERDGSAHSSQPAGAAAAASGPDSLLRDGSSDGDDGAGEHFEVVDEQAQSSAAHAHAQAPALRVPLPAWAILAGGSRQLRWLRNLRASGRSLHAARLALHFVEAAVKLGCGSLDTTLAAADADSRRVAEAAAAAGAGADASTSGHIQQGQAWAQALHSNSGSGSGSGSGSLDLSSVHVPLHALTSAALWHRSGNAQQHLRLHLLALAQYARVPAALLSALGQGAATPTYAMSCTGDGDASGSELSSVTMSIAFKLQARAPFAATAPTAEDAAVPDVAALLACPPEASSPGTGGSAATPGQLLHNHDEQLPAHMLPAAATPQLASSASMASFALRAVAERLDRGVALESPTARLCAAISPRAGAAGVPDAVVCKAQLLARAAALSELAVRLQPHDAVYRTNAATAALAAGAVAEGLVHAQAALSLRPADASVLSNYGFALERSGREGEALDAYRRAAELAPHHPQIVRNYETLRQRLRL